MTGHFRYKRNNSRGKLLALLGLGLIALASTPYLSAQQLSDFPQPTPSEARPLSFESSPWQQVDDPWRDDPKLTDTLQAEGRGYDLPHWPPMSPEQIEQTRTTLIREGFSPMQAEAILPTTALP